ncbi:MAG: sulfatase-like hydrolase/transferase, partial [Psychrobium sp.]
FGFETGLPAIYKPAFNQQKLSSPLIELTNGSLRKSFGAHQDSLSDKDALAVDGDNVDSMIEWIKQARTTPYFGNLTLYASQHLSIGNNPLLKFDSSQLQHGSAPQRVLAAQYINSLHYTDALLGKLLSHVDLNKTTLVITGSRGNDLNRLYNQTSSDYSQVNLSVPLVIVGPQFSELTVNKPTSHYDVLPTLLNSHFQCGNPATDVSVGYDLKSTQHSNMFYLGDAQSFALYKNGNSTQIDRQGQYRFFDKDYIRQDSGKLSFQSLIDLMANIERFEP